MLILDRGEIPHRTEIEDDERLSITNVGHVKCSGPEGGSSLTKMDSPAVVIYELVEEARA